MKKFVSLIIVWLWLLTSVHATDVSEIPDKFYVTQHWISYTTSFDIETDTNKLGSLYRRVLSLNLSYDFYDIFNTKLATAKARFFSIGAHFDIYDQQDQIIGSVKEKIFTFFPSFEIYSSDSTVLVNAEMNFWGTKFTLYDRATGSEIGIMTRPYFRLKNDWTIQITNKNLLKKRNIKPSLFMTVLAFQGDLEEWRKQDNNSMKVASSRITTQLQEIKEKIASLTKEQHLDTVAVLKEGQLEEVAKKLDENYQNYLGHQTEQTPPAKQIKDFTDFCFNQIESNDIDRFEKKAIIYLLNKRLEVF